MLYLFTLLLKLFIPVFFVHSIVSNSEQSYVTGTNANREEIQKSSICYWVLSFHAQVHFKSICCLKSNCLTFKDFSCWSPSKIESQTGKANQTKKKMLLLHLFSKKLCMYVMFYTWVKKSLKWKHLCISEKALNGSCEEKSVWFLWYWLSIFLTGILPNPLA